jgi:hypothetical protein
VSDPKQALASKFKPQNRFDNFGSVIVSAKINGFRGIKAEIKFEYPVTAISGFNGSGKSTIGQLSLCGCRKLTSAVNSKRYYVVNFFPVSILDPKPFSDDASMIFTYQTDKPGVYRDLTVSRATTEWSGYSARPSEIPSI